MQSSERRAPMASLPAILVGVVVIADKAMRRLAEGDAPAAPAVLAGTVAIWSGLAIGALLLASGAVRRARARVASGPGPAGALAPVASFALGGIAAEGLTHLLLASPLPEPAAPRLTLGWAFSALDLWAPYLLAATRLAPVRVSRHALVVLATLVGYGALVALRHALPGGAIASVALAAAVLWWLARDHRRGARALLLP